MVTVIVDFSNHSLQRRMNIKQVVAGFCSPPPKPEFESYFITFSFDCFIR